MKRFVLGLLACLAIESLMAQVPEVGEYEARFDVRIRRDPGNNHDGDCRNKFNMYTTLTGEAEQHVWAVNLNPIGTAWKTIPTEYFTIPANKKITKIRFRGERNWQSWGNCNGDVGWSETYLSYGGCFTRTYNEIIPEWDDEVKINIYPKRINLYYFNRAGQREISSAKFYLPQSHKIQIKATSDFPASVYGWQYQVGSGTWTNLPPSLYSRNVLSFSGNDIPGIDFINDVLLQNKNIKIRISYGCGGYSGIMTLRPLLSSPDITTVQEEAPSCSYNNDGKLTVTFNRALYAGETLTFVLDGILQSPMSISVLNPGNTFTLTNYASFSNRILSFIGRFNGLNTYTDDPTAQNRTVSVPERLPIIFTATPYPVHCFEGENGRVEVTGQDGSGNYTSYLMLGADTVQQISLTSSVGNIFSALKAGAYRVGIKDSNGCDPKDGSGNVIYLDGAITQPPQKLSLSTVETVEPLGFGLQNGYITVRSENGTAPYTFDWTDASNNTRIADAPVSEGSSMKSTLPGIGKGIYHVRSQDANYALVFPQTEVNLRGCYDTLTIKMDQPPLLEVFIEQKHFVSCHGYADGEIVAHAKGGRPYAFGNLYHPYQYEWFVVDGGLLTAFGISDSTATDRPSKVYRIKVTDRNGILAWSEDFTLGQPDVLSVNFVTSELLCSGDSNGTSKAIVEGGTPAYNYAWSTEETTSEISHLVGGWYSVVVIDARGCTIYNQTEVKTPNSLEAEALLDYPTCSGYADGSVDLTVTGGRTPYTYAWQHGADTSDINNLGEGEYHVVITDANGCFITRDYLLEDPALFQVSLGPDRVLCKDQTLDLDVTITDPGAQYSWLKDGAPFASTPAIQLFDAGTYRLRITDSNGCLNEDELNIDRNNSEISASIIVATRVPLAGIVRVANISYPAADRVAWIVPKEATIVAETSGYLDISFATKGEYAIGLTSFRGSCEKTVFSPVRVVDRSELTDYQTPLEPYIKQFMVTPNPNDGRFTATVELREIGDFRLILFNSKGIIVEQKEIKSQLFIRVDFEASALVSAGIYLLQLTTQQGLSTFKVVIE